LHLKSSTEWIAYVQSRRPDKGTKPADIPSSPRNTYGEQWLGWGDWLGTGNVAPFRKKFRSFEEARAFARTLGCRTKDDWDAWSKIPGNRPVNIPASPASTYKNKGWIDWHDFLQQPE